MATTYLSPGVYVEEVSGGVKPIAGVGTSTGAFVGIAEKGVIGKAVLVTNWTQFVKEFGGFIPTGYLAYAVYGFFAEGGTSCYVVRTCHYTTVANPNSKTAVVSGETLVDDTAIAAAVTLVDSTGAKCMKVSALSEGTEGNNISVEITDAYDTKFKITVSKGTTDEVFDNLTMADVEDKVNSGTTMSKLIMVEKDTWKEGAVDVTGSGNPPKNQTITLIDGKNDDPCMHVSASSEGTWGDYITIKIVAASEVTTGFKIIVSYKGPNDKEAVDIEIFDNLTMADVEEKVKSTSSFIRVEKDAWNEDGSDVTGSGMNPKKEQTIILSGGGAGLADLAVSDFSGDESAQNGLHAFDVVDDINIVAIPDKAGDRGVILEALTYCKNRKDCFFIADSPKELSPTVVRDFKKATGNYSGNAFNSSYGALYYPWVYINDPLTGKKKLIPPSGVVAGTYAYTDSARGVHKAPAGISEGYLDSVVGIERIITKGEHDVLNPEKINVIRSLPSGICIWGARTLSADSEWLYVNVRRLLLYIEESIDEGTQWVVFEPNDPMLWGKVKRNITAFLTRVWRDGALFGSTPEEAFFVKVDEENNPPEVIDAGQLIIEVGVAPVKPAEFVIIRISQKTLAKA